MRFRTAGCGLRTADFPPLRLRLLPALALCAVAAACGGDDRAASGGADSVPEAERYGGTLVIGASADIGDISPLTWHVQNALYMQQFVLFAPLIAYDRELRPVPRLARRWEVNADTTLLTFHLRDDVYWHDGVKTTARDVKFSYDLARDPRSGFIYSGLWTHYGEAEAPDSFTFRIRLRPHAEFLDVWRVFAPVPEHVLRGTAPDALARHPFATQRPVGNGPFRFVSRAPGQSWTFAANPRWPRELGGRPYADRLVYRVIPEPAAMLTELETGGIDLLVAPAPEYAARIRASARARLADFPDLVFEHLVWNHRRPPFDDARVRRALTLAIDRQRIVQVVRGGAGTVANSTVAPLLWQHDSTAGRDLGHDPGAARRLLAEAGFADRDGDGVLESRAGRPFRFTLKVPHGNRERGDIAQIVQGDLRRVGVQARVQEVEFNALLGRASDPRQRDFDALVLGWKPEFRVDDSDLFACAKRDNPMAFAGYCSAETDRLLDSVGLVADRAAARPLWERYQHRIAADQPFTILYFPNRLEGVARRVQGAEPDARGDWVGVERWWILPSMR
ncbi:MAG TPA: ABC transporter substrate-binding protein [Longimicrobiaceae bacterium]|nr:ABC transporter substrate-binding protein [Longimicrobiaceae bacterium]